LNGTNFGSDENFLYPLQHVTINGVSDTFSQRHADSCSPFYVNQVPTEQPFDLSRVAIVGNAVCASTCSAFSTLMQELHGVKIANFGAAKQAYSGMAEAEVLDWPGLDSEFKVSTFTQTVRVSSRPFRSIARHKDCQPEDSPACGSRTPRQRKLPDQLAVSLP
jgi:hypothetical protein